MNRKMSKRIERLKNAVQVTHRCKATHLESELIFETTGGTVVWDGVVAVFKIAKHPTAKVCYAWGYSDETDDQFVAVLGLPPIKSASDAVRAYIASGIKSETSTAASPANASRP